MENQNDTAERAEDAAEFGALTRTEEAPVDGETARVENPEPLEAQADAPAEPAEPEPPADPEPAEAAEPEPAEAAEPPATDPDPGTVEQEADASEPEPEPERAADAEPSQAQAAPEPEVGAPAAAPRKRSRRATRPASTPSATDAVAVGDAAEPALDVFAAFGEVPPGDGGADVEPAVAEAIDLIVFAAPAGPPPEAGTEEAPADADLRLPAATLLFQAPDVPPARSRRRRPAASAVVAEVAPEPTSEAEPSPEGAGADEDAEPDGERTGPAAAAARRRRRRGGRGRRRATAGDGAESDAEAGEPDEIGGPAEDLDAEDAESAEATDEAEDEAGATTRRRRRRRRARPADGGGAAPEEAGPIDEVTALKGSTRLEAKRQRRREGRDAGRRRTIVTEAEFLARRESVERTMVVREREGRTQIAVLEDNVLVEHFVARRTQTSMVGNVYLGRVQNVLPSMEAAFVDIGRGRNAVLYAGEVNWDAAGMEGQPRRIEQALSAGDSVLVQVTKDPIGHKGARLTSQITLAGRYLVLVPGGGMTGISRKLPDTERARLKRLLREIVPEGAGVIVRTAAEGASEEELRLDVQRLQAQWADVERKSTTSSAPALLSSEPDLAIRVVRDVFNEDFTSLVISGEEAWGTVADYVGSVAPDLAPRLARWTDARDVFAANRIDEQLAKALDRKVWLPSGGSLIIDRTEAMTVVDVNTGKFTGSGGTLEETVTRNNLEAAEEIVRQLRLRDIGGIIVIDFIDMVLESNRDLVLRRLVECLGRDRTRHQVAEVTSLGLVQMTRKRVGQGLLEAFSEPCDCCSGRGYLVRSEPVEKVVASSEAVDDGARQASSRRRGRRPAEAPAARPPADDAKALAAREAVKATLATIAAAAAHAHEGAEHGQEDGADREQGPPGVGERSGETGAVLPVPEVLPDFDALRAEPTPQAPSGTDEGGDDADDLDAALDSIDFDAARGAAEPSPVPEAEPATWVAEAL